MKNHWIQVYEKKKRKIWTAEFSKNGIYSLKPRRVSVVDPKYSLGLMGQNHGMVSIIFKDAMFAINDKELMDFLSDAHYHNMSGYNSRIRMYQGLSVELENYELTGLSYDSLGSGDSLDDIKFTFSFKHVRHFHVA
jgi:hypothetical protein